MSRLSAKLVCSAALSLALIGSAGCERRQEPVPEQWAPTPSLSHQARPLPKGSFEGSGKSLLDEYGSRTPRDASEAKTWLLPNNGKTIIVEALIAAALDDPTLMLQLMTSTASWGWPTRGQLRGRPISTKSDPYGFAFFDAFRGAASRFKAKAKFSCIPLQPNWSMLAEAGAEPMWCNYTADDGLDLLVFRLVKFKGDVKIDYVGLFVDRPTGPTYVPGAGTAPPPTPYTKMLDSDKPKPMPMSGTGPRTRSRMQPTARPRPGAADRPISVQADRNPDKPISVKAGN